MSNSVNVRSGVARHGRMIVSIILFQSLLILWLAAWAIEDYINNQYVRAYVDLTIQSDGWIFGTLGFLGILGAVMGMVLRRRHDNATLELVNTGVKVPMGTAVRGSKASLPSGRTVPVSNAATIATTVTATGNVVQGPKPTVELHPAVAALKAELSEARMSLGLASVGSGQSSVSSGRPENLRPQGPQLQVSQPQTAPARPQSPVMGGIVPPTVIRPMAPPGPSGQNLPPGIRLTPQTVIRPVLPTPGPAGAQQNQPKPVGAQPGTGQPSQIDVSTVITGILPDQQKKKDANAQNRQNSQ